MSVIGSNILAGASGQGGGYNISRSLRFRTAPSQTYLTRTPSSTGNRRTFTYSTWVKRAEYTYWRGLLGSGDIGTVGIEYLRFSNDGSGVGAPLCNIEFGTYGIAGTAFNVFTTSSFRDISAWYHVVLAVDTTQATEANRVKIYVNNVQQTLVGTYPTQNTDTFFNSSSYAQAIGDIATTGLQAFDGYMTETRMIDGQQLTPSSFGTYSSTTGVWQPKAYAGTYGTNGYFLNFSNNASTTTLGYDFSGNGNNYTANNFSLTAGATYDSMTDVPTLTSATASNFATLNPLMKPSVVTLSNGNLTSALAGAYNGFANWYMSSGKWYWEITVGNNPSVSGLGISSNPTFTTVFYTESDSAYYYGTGEKYVNGGGSAYGASFTTGDVIGVALDVGANTVTFYKNNTSQGSISITSGKTWTPSFGSGNGGVSITNDWNFGQRPFAYTPPTGFVALNTYNLPTPSIGATASTQANKNFDVTLWTGNSTTRSITNSGEFQPDFVWAKCRSTGYNHALFDSVRGVNKALFSSSTGAEISPSASGGVSSFNSNGFSLQVGTSDWNQVNNNGDTYVGWQWKASGSTVSNTAGDIASTVSVNATAGFSVVTYNCPSSGSGNKTIGHGLGVAPAMIIVKSRNYTYGWDVYHQSLGYNASLVLNSTNGTRSGAFGANPTSTVFTATQTYTWDTNINYVAYCFSEVAGYSKFGKYTGNGNADGAFVYTGFRPKFVMIKRSDSGNNWFILDTSRDTYNLANRQLLPNSSAAESTGSDCNIDILSNGFKLRTALDASNGSGGTYVYAAFAENPYKYSLAR